MKFLILCLTLSAVASAQTPEAVPAKKKATVEKPAKKTDASAEKPAPAAKEPSTWEKVKETTGEVYDYSKEKAGEAVEYGAEKTQNLNRSLGKVRERRGNSKWTITGNYSLFEMWVLSKYGLTVGYNRSASSTYELEYMRGSLGFGYFGLDVGEISEQRLGLLWRSYNQRNAFNFTTGIYYNWMDIHLGSDLLSSVSGYQTQVDVMELQTMGISWGLGNRWQTKGGFVWGADWFTINIPVWIVKQEHPFIDASNDPQARDDAQDTLKILRRIPSMAAVKIQLGFSF